jgi:hypothetical protein
MAASARESGAILNDWQARANRVVLLPCVRFSETALQRAWGLFSSSAEREAEILALRHRINVFIVRLPAG